MKTVIELVKKHMEDNGFEGLLQEDGECACKLDDLVPCDQNPMYCKFGYVTRDPSGEFDFLVTTKKPKP